MRLFGRGFAIGIVVALATYGLVGCGSAPDALGTADNALALGTVVFQSTLSPHLNGIVEQAPINTQPEDHAFDGTFTSWDISGATLKISHQLFWNAKDFTITLNAGATPYPHFGINCTIYPRASYPGVNWQAVGLLPAGWLGVPGLNFSGVYGDSYQVPLGRNTRNSISSCSDEGGGWIGVDPIEVLAGYIPAAGTNYLSPKVLTASTKPVQVVLRVDLKLPQYGVVNRYLFGFTP